MTDPEGPRPQSLDEALAMLQADPPVLLKDKSGQVGNQKTRYADLVQVNRVVLSRLNALGVIYKTKPTQLDDGKFVLEYKLTHVPSGECEVGLYPLKLSENPMQMGSAITYARRYVLLALTGVAAEDEDDDGHAAGSRGTAQRAPARPAKAAPERQAQRAAAKPAAPPLPTDGPQPYTPQQRGKLMAGFGQIGIEDRAERLDICSRLVGRELGSANDLTKEEARKVIDALEQAAKQDSPVLWLAEQTGPADTDQGGDLLGDPPMDPAEAG